MKDNEYKLWDKARRVLAESYLADLPFGELALVAGIECPGILKYANTRNLLSKEWFSIIGVLNSSDLYRGQLLKIVCDLTEKLTKDHGLAKRISSQDVKYLLSRRKHQNPMHPVGSSVSWDIYRQIVVESQYSTFSLKQLAELTGELWTKENGELLSETFLKMTWVDLVRKGDLAENERDLLSQIISDVAVKIDDERYNLKNTRNTRKEKGADLKHSDLKSQIRSKDSPKSNNRQLWEECRQVLSNSPKRKLTMRKAANLLGIPETSILGNISIGEMLDLDWEYLEIEIKKKNLSKLMELATAVPGLPIKKCLRRNRKRKRRPTP